MQLVTDGMVPLCHLFSAACRRFPHSLGGFRPTGHKRYSINNTSVFCMAVTEIPMKSIPDFVEAEDHDENDEGDEGTPETVGAGGMWTDIMLYFIQCICTAEGKRKKKKKRTKKKKPGSVEAVQTDPPRIGLSKFFPTGHFPEGEIQEYTDE